MLKGGKVELTDQKFCSKFFDLMKSKRKNYNAALEIFYNYANTC